MPPSEILRRVTLLWTDFSEERIASIISHIVLIRSMLPLLVSANVVPNTPIHVTLMMEKTLSSEHKFL
jgi:hypothetical protein